MALEITKNCINCYGCETVCPSNAISVEGGQFIIDPARCNECDDIESSRCIAICPEPGVIVKLR